MATATLPGPAPALDVPDDCEVVYGHIYGNEPMSLYAGVVANNLHEELVVHTRRTRTGRSRIDIQYRIPLPDDTSRVRIPDVAYVSYDRWPADRPFPTSGNPMDAVPDLAVEVVSPTDAFEDVVAKAREYLSAGCGLVWVIVPVAQNIYVYEPGRATPTVLAAADTLTGGDVLPGFAVRVGDLFPPGVPA